MFRALRCIEIAGVSLSLIWGLGTTVFAGDPSWGRLQSSGTPSDASASAPVYYYNNAAPSNSAPAVATAPNANSVTYRSYSVDPGSNTGFYYYSPGPCGCYSYAPGPSPTAATSAATPNGTAPAATVANAPPGTYRSFSPDPAPPANYYYSNPGTYYRSTSSGGHSWGGRR